MSTTKITYPTRLDRNDDERNASVKGFKKRLLKYEAKLEKIETSRKKGELFVSEEDENTLFRPSPSMYFNPKYLVLREIYWYVSDKLERKSVTYKDEEMSGEEALYRRLETLCKFSSRTKRNPFNYMLVFLADLNCLSGSAAFRSKYARCMQYAYDHEIEPIWLQSFIEMSGGINVVAQKYVDGEVELWADEVLDPKLKVFNKGSNGEHNIENKREKKKKGRRN